jgi:hypothetical protein
MPDGAPQPKEREEFQLVGDWKEDGETRLLSGVRNGKVALELERDGPWPSFTNVRIQKRTVTETPCEDVTDA